MSIIHAPEARRLDARLLIFPGVMLVALGAMFLRLWYLQVVEGQALAERAATFQFTTIPKLAPRGLIVDRNGVILAGVKPQIVITARPGIVKKSPQSLEKLARLSDTPLSKLQDKVGREAWRPFMPVPVLMSAPIALATKIAEAGDELPGLGVESQPMRSYTDTTHFSHVLGYVWTPSDKDLRRLERRGVKPSGYVGKTGIEYQYEPELMGTPGSERMEVDAKRRPVRSVAQDNAVPGTKLVLSLDVDLQKFALEQLAGRRGAVVALDPKRGEVLCLASAPTFDISLFEGGITLTDWQRLENDPEKPQINRAIYSSYAPGSAFKIITTLAAISEGKLSPTETIYCPGYYQVGDKQFKCLGRHGAISFERAFAKSCNTYFSTLGMRAGPDAIRRICKQVGLGARTGVDLPGEGRGVVPTQEWLNRWREPPKWYAGDTVNFSVGQGEVALTPLQMACVGALVANNGVSYRPHLVRATIPPGPDRKPTRMDPEVLGRVKLPSEAWSLLKEAMVQVVEGGTGTRARIPGLIWGGKTGSAENRRNQETHSWFVGIAPIEHPKIVVAVLVENAGHGGEVAAPIAGEIVQHYLTAKALKSRIQSKAK